MKRDRSILMAGFACGMILLFARLAVSQETETIPTPVATPIGTPIPQTADFSARVSSYEPSFIGWVFDDEPHVNFQISIRYPFLPFEAWGSNTTTAFIGYRSGLYIAYTGRFDLYFQRPSAPTITREHNPGLYFDFNRCFDQPLLLTVGYFHDSNGQVIDTRAKYTAITEHAQDYVSRGWDYLLLAESYTWTWQDHPEQGVFRFTPSGTLSQWFRYDPTIDQSSLTVRVQGLYFMEKQGFGAAWKEEGIFWEDVTSQPQRSDYDGIRFSLIYQNAYFRLADVIRTGYTASNLTNDLSFTFRIGRWLPVSLQWHRGFGPDLSTYYLPSQYLALGIELSDYLER